MLFKVSDIEVNENSSSNRFVKQAATGLLQFNQEGWKEIREQIGTLEPDKYHHFTSEGMWSAIHLLEYLLAQCGPSDIWMTTWSISEDAIRRLVMLHENGDIKSVTALFDRRVKIYSPSAYSFAERHFNIKLMAIHAKVTVVKGEKYTVAVSQSANYNQNKRVETGIVMTVLDSIEYYINWIENLHGRD